jgi:glycosyltransferase involved in cell wall biosynthesis
VDELVIVVGRGEDDTLEKVRALALHEPKLRIYESTWDDSLRKDGLILSQQTNLAMSYCRGKWGIYLQADEVLHEADLAAIRRAAERAEAMPEVDGLLFNYLHFYGDFFVVNRNPSVYRREIRAVRLIPEIVSWKDAQGFRKRQPDGSFAKLKVIESGARIFHYGWVRPPEVMKEKTVAMDKLYHGDAKDTGDNSRYKRIYGLERFTDSHPAVMLPRIEEKRWKVDLMAAPLVFKAKDVRKLITRNIERLTGWLPFEYKNYIRAK